MQVREFIDGTEISQALLVRDVELRSRRDGGEYLKLTLGDRTGTVPAVVWDGVGEARARSVREGLSRLAESSILERYV